jgi:hypothetical protein
MNLKRRGGSTGREKSSIREIFLHKVNRDMQCLCSTANIEGGCSSFNCACNLALGVVSEIIELDFGIIQLV